MDYSEYDLTIGQTFGDYEELTKSFDVFCKKYHHPFVIRTRSEKQILYKCCHGIRQNSKCQGKRPGQRYYYNGCEAQINVYKGKNNRWKITKMVVDHNHKIGEEEFRYYGRAKRSLDTNDSFLENTEDSNQMSDRDKFMFVLDVTKNIANILSNCDMKSFNNYINELKIIEQNARNGKSLLVNEKINMTNGSLEE